MIVPPTVTHCEPFHFWIAIVPPVPPGVTVPEKRMCRPRLTLCLLTLLFTYGLTPNATIGLTTAGRSGIWTRNCMFTATDSSGNEKCPLASVTCSLVTFWKPAVYGHQLACRTTLRPALPVPLRVPDSVVPESAALTGFGLAASVTPSGCLRVLNERRLPSVVPELLRATIR
jgi:hypothetical protein